VVVVHDAPLCPISLRLLPYASQNPRAVHCEALLTTLCFGKRQVISKRRLQLLMFLQPSMIALNI
jgi:hypothetical protein